MDVLEAISKRRTIRKFLDIPVEDEKIGTLLAAGSDAPSAGNLQSWKFILVRNPGKRAAIAEASVQQVWMAEAPVFIVICAEMKRIRQFYGKRGETLYANQACSAAAENMVLAAMALDLGSFWVSAFDTSKIKGILLIPDGVDIEPLIILGFGYPDEAPKKPLRYRLDNITYFERWGAQSIGKIKDINSVLWNYRLLERGMRSSREGLAVMEKALKQGKRGEPKAEKEGKKLFERLMEEGRKLREKIEQRAKKEKKP